MADNIVENFETKIQSIKSRIETIKSKKAEATAQLTILKQQYDQKVKELKDLGIEDLSNLPKLISDKEQELQNLVESTDVELQRIELQIQ